MIHSSLNVRFYISLWWSGLSGSLVANKSTKLSLLFTYSVPWNWILTDTIILSTDLILCLSITHSLFCLNYSMFYLNCLGNFYFKLNSHSKLSFPALIPTRTSHQTSDRPLLHSTNVPLNPTLYYTLACIPILVYRRCYTKRGCSHQAPQAAPLTAQAVPDPW